MMMWDFKESVLPKNIVVSEVKGLVITKARILINHLHCYKGK